MREIKFRGKDKDTKKWVFGDLKHECIEQCNMMNGNYGAPYLHHYQTVNGHEIIDGTLGQLTGLQDCKGNDIYEGDIVKWGHIGGMVEVPVRIATVDIDVSLLFTGINVKHVFCWDNFMYNDTEKFLEIIGNIHDNMELLEGQ